MDERREVREFLVSRRARITPEQAGLPGWGGDHRRVPGLRREEVALLAGVSIDYYIRVERGNLGGVSDTVLDAIADALALDPAERTHLTNLARAAQTGTPPRRPARPHQVRPELQRILDAVTEAPAYLRNGRRDLLATNRLGRALYAPLYAGPERPVNVARFVFLDPAAPTFFRDWSTAARDLVAALRIEVGHHPRDRALSDLVGELTTRSDEFATCWAAQNVRFHRSGVKHLHHPAVGDLELSFEAMELPADPGLSLIVYSAAPGSSSSDALKLLTTWAATTNDHESPSAATSESHPRIRTR